MKDTEIEKLLEFAVNMDVFVPNNDPAKELLNITVHGEVVYFKEVSARDIKYFKCYMAFLNYIYDLLPERFHKIVEKRKFYKWLKHLKKDYDNVYSFTDHEKYDFIKTELMTVLNEELSEKFALKFGKTDMLEYTSISFSRMTEKKFREYVRGQLPYLYENVIGAFYDGESYTNVIEEIEMEFEKFLSKI